jgi:soluble lytic murein transglycosylase-like protein
MRIASENLSPICRGLAGRGNLRRCAAAFISVLGILLLVESGIAHAQTAAADAASLQTVKATPDMELPPGNARPLVSGAMNRADIVTEIERAARGAGLPAEIAEAVAHTESRFNQYAAGADGEVGLMQVLPSTARMMGFSGTNAELGDPKVNIHYGVRYLAGAYRLAGGDLCTTVMKYRAGHGETRFSHLSVDYCRKVRTRLASRGFAVVGDLPVATFGRPAGGGGGGGCRGRCLASSGSGADLAALNSKLNDLVFRVTVVKVPRP